MISTQQVNGIQDVRIVSTQTSDIDDIKVYRCFLKASHIIKRCGQCLGDDQLVGHYTKIIDPGHDACKTLIERSNNKS